MLYFFQGFEVFLVGQHVVEPVELFVPAEHPFWSLLLLCVRGQIVQYCLPVPLHDRTHHSKECQFLLLLLTQQFVIELDELEEYPLQKELGFLRSLLYIHDCGEHVVDESSGDEVISKVDELQDTPAIDDGAGQEALVHLEQMTMKSFPIFEDIVALLLSILESKHCFFQLFFLNYLGLQLHHQQNFIDIFQSHARAATAIPPPVPQE